MSPKSFRPPSASPTVGVRAPAPRESRAPSHKFRPLHVRMRRSFPIRVRCGRVRVDEVYDGMGGRTRLGALVRCSDRSRKNSRSGRRLKNNAPAIGHAGSARNTNSKRAAPETGLWFLPHPASCDRALRASRFDASIVRWLDTTRAPRLRTSTQNSHEPGKRGKAIASRMLVTPVT